MMRNLTKIFLHDTSSLVFDVPIIDNNIAEPNKEVIVTITIPSPQPAVAKFVGGGLSRNATIFILNDDEELTGKLCFKVSTNVKVVDSHRKLFFYIDVAKC